MSEANDVYYESLFTKKRGHPLFTPEPDENWPDERRKVGIDVGDVGILTPDGSFDVLYNLLKPANHPLNWQGIPMKHQPIDLPARGISKGRCETNTVLAGMGAKASAMDGSFHFSCCKQGGALFLPDGALQEDWMFSHDDLKSSLILSSPYVFKFARDDLGRMASHIIFVTGHDKTRSWGIASFLGSSGTGELSINFDRHASGGQWSYRQETSSCAMVRFSADTPSFLENQCVFIRGMTLSVRDPGFDDEDIAEPYSPAAVINKWLLEIMPQALVAVTHDDDWRAVIGEEDQILSDNELIRRILELYEPKMMFGGAILVPRMPSSISTNRTSLNSLSRDVHQNASVQTSQSSRSNHDKPIAIPRTGETSIINTPAGEEFHKVAPGADHQECVIDSNRKVINIYNTALRDILCEDNVPVVAIMGREFEELV